MAWALARALLIACLLVRGEGAITPCGMHDMNPFLTYKTLTPVLNQTDRELATNCSSVFGVRDLMAACQGLEQDQASSIQIAKDAGLIQAQVCPQTHKTLLNHLKICTGTSDRTLPTHASSAAVRTHLLFCHHHLTCSLETLEQDCEDGRFWLVQRLGEVCFARPAKQGGGAKGPLYKQAVATCEETYGRPLQETVADISAQVNQFRTHGRIEVGADEAALRAFRTHLLALAESQKAKREGLALEKAREALFVPDDDDDDGDDRQPPSEAPGQRPSAQRRAPAPGQQGHYEPVITGLYSVV